MTTTSLLPDIGTELREGYAQIGDTNLHYVEAGDGPLIVLLHGFPEFWFGWRLQIEPLAAAGFRVVAPDTRGYNLSSKPEGFEDYAVDLLAAGNRTLRGGVVAARGSGRNDQLLPRIGEAVAEGSRGKASPDLSADAGDLGGARFLPRLRPRRARARRCAQPRPRGAPA